jgi:Tfp pilus assembly protein PilF
MTTNNTSKVSRTVTWCLRSTLTTLVIKLMPHSNIETLAMKALSMNALKKRTEALDFIKKALFKNMSNFTCWHVYGIIHRSNKNNDDARKAYLNALKSDPANQNVLRDLGQLQI